MCHQQNLTCFWKKCSSHSTIPWVVITSISRRLTSIIPEFSPGWRQYELTGFCVWSMLEREIVCTTTRRKEKSKRTKRKEARMSNYQRFCADVQKQSGTCPLWYHIAWYDAYVLLRYTNLCCIHTKNLWDPQCAKRKENRFIACMQNLQRKEPWALCLYRAILVLENENKQTQSITTTNRQGGQK